MKFIPDNGVTPHWDGISSLFALSHFLVDVGNALVCWHRLVLVNQSCNSNVAF